MRKGKEFKFNIYFNNDGEKLETIITEAILHYLKNDIKGLISN